MTSVNGKKTTEGAIESTRDCSCNIKSTPRTEEMQIDLQKRLNRAIGQLNGVKTMIDENRYCGDILIQLAAVQSAVRSVSTNILHNHLETCVVEEIQEGNLEIIDEVMQLVRKYS